MSEISWLLPQTPVTEVELHHFESASGYSLPEDFKNWLLEHNGSCPDPQEIPLIDGFILVINAFVSFSEKDTSNAFSVLKFMKEDRSLEGIIPIAEDYGGNYVCLRYSSKNDEPDIIFWDHEEADPAVAIQTIASSFTEFIQRLETNE